MSSATAIRPKASMTNGAPPAEICLPGGAQLVHSRARTFAPYSFGSTDFRCVARGGAGRGSGARYSERAADHCRPGVPRKAWRRTLRRRSQKDGLTWDTLTKLADHWLPAPRILHPWPDQRFAVKHPR